MAWTTYTGRHRIRTVREGAHCIGVRLDTGSQYPNPIGTVCKKDNGRFEYSYVGGGHYLRGDLPTARAAVKKAVAGYRSWMGVTTKTSLGRARRRKRR